MDERFEPIELAALNYDAQNFRDLAETPLGQAIWIWLKQRDNQVRMLTATFLERAAVEPLAPGLVREFGTEVAEDRIKQMIGHMVKQIMAAMGYDVDRPGLRITRVSLFTSGARYRSRSSRQNRSMTITREQREAWASSTAKSSFNRWLDAQVKHEDGALNIERLYEVARRYGIEKEYRNLNNGQQRMNIGVMLRSRVPPAEYEAS